MNEKLADYYYRQALNSSNSDLKQLEKFKKVNTFLKKNDWLFVAPIFFQGYELDGFLKLSESDEKDKKEKILKTIIKKFYDLGRTASFVEGYCSRCTYIKPFLKSIEYSIILIFQKDYEGGIKTIIPIIEGIFRKYLITEKGYTNEKIQYKDLSKGLEMIKQDIVENYTVAIKQGRKENGILIEFSEHQIKNMFEKETECLCIWFSFAEEFVTRSFYVNTKKETITNHVNRHSILHELGNNFEYNFENYIKIYFLLQFLTWAFLLKEKQSFLDEIDSYRYLEKVTSYKNIIELSEKLLYEKHLLLKNYPDYQDTMFKQEFPVYQKEILPEKHSVIYRLLRRYDKFLWKKNLK